MRPRHDASGETKTMDVLLIRHTPVDAAPGTCYGRRDLPLLQPALAAFEAVEAALPPVDHVVGSPLRRCSELTHWLAQRRGVAVTLEPRWQELDFGQWEGRRWDDIGRTQRAALNRWALDPMGFAAPGGESVRALHVRTQAALASLRGHAAAQGWRRVAVVTHGGPIRTLLTQAMGSGSTKMNALEVPFGGLFALRHAQGDWRRVTLEQVRAAARTTAAPAALRGAADDVEDACAP
jgi:alpha-ribazole phosphatase